jgi:hypothetical protein
MDFTQQLSLGAEAMHPILGRGPHIAFGVDAKPVRQAGRDLSEHLASGELGVAADTESANVVRTVRVVGKTGIGDIE